MAKKYKYNQKKYNDFLFNSELFEGISTYLFTQEPLALALLTVLCKKGIVEHMEVVEAFNEILRIRLTGGGRNLDDTAANNFKYMPLKQFLDDITGETPAAIKFPHPSKNEQ